jgi:hypothetical protein
MLRQLGIFLLLFGIFFPTSVRCTKKNLATPAHRVRAPLSFVKNTQRRGAFMFSSPHPTPSASKPVDGRQSSQWKADTGFVCAGKTQGSLTTSNEKAFAPILVCSSSEPGQAGVGWGAGLPDFSWCMIPKLEQCTL